MNYTDILKQIDSLNKDLISVAEGDISEITSINTKLNGLRKYFKSVSPTYANAASDALIQFIRDVATATKNAQKAISDLKATTGNITIGALAYADKEDGPQTEVEDNQFASAIKDILDSMNAPNNASEDTLDMNNPIQPQQQPVQTQSASAMLNGMQENAINSYVNNMKMDRYNKSKESMPFSFNSIMSNINGYDDSIYEEHASELGRMTERVSSAVGGIGWQQIKESLPADAADINSSMPGMPGISGGFTPTFSPSMESPVTTSKMTETVTNPTTSNKISIMETLREGSMGAIGGGAADLDFSNLEVDEESFNNN